MKFVAELVVQTAETYQKLLDKIEYLETIAGIKSGLADIEAGHTTSLSEIAKHSPFPDSRQR